MKGDYVWFLKSTTSIHYWLITAEQTQAASMLHKITKINVMSVNTVELWEAFQRTGGEKAADTAFIPAESLSFSYTDVMNDSSCFSSIMIKNSRSVRKRAQKEKRRNQKSCTNTNLYRNATQLKLGGKYCRSMQLNCSKHWHAINYKVWWIFAQATLKSQFTQITYKFSLTSSCI